MLPMSVSDINKKVLNQVLNNQFTPPQQQQSAQVSEIAEKDRALRHAVSDLYMSLSQSGDPRTSIDILATHVAMMVEMINEFKSQV